MWRPALAAVSGAIGTFSPIRALPIPDPGFYHRSISADKEREWHYNHNLKEDLAFLPRVGWTSAVMCGHAAVAAGLGIEIPALMLINIRSDPSRTWNGDMHYVNLVLNIDALVVRAPQLGDHVTLIRTHGGRHDLALPQEEPRCRFLDEIQRWLAVYGPGDV